MAHGEMMALILFSFLRNGSIITITDTDDRLFSSPNQRNGVWPLDLMERECRQQQKIEEEGGGAV